MTDLLLLAWVFMKISLFCWGGGIVILPMIEDEVVWKYGWLTQREFLDAITLGQVSPGPIVISATFIGYQVQGLAGAVVATFAVIAPAAALMCLAAQAVEKFRNNALLMGFFHTSRAAVIGLVFDAALSLGRTSMTNTRMVAVFAASLFVLLKFKVGPVWVLLAAAVLSLVT